MNLRVLVVGPEFYLYNDSICNAFKEIGCEAEILAYSERVIFGESTNLANRLLHPGDSKGIMEFPARTVTDVRRFIKSKDLLIGPEVLESRRFGRGVEKEFPRGIRSPFCNQRKWAPARNALKDQSQDQDEGDAMDAR